MIREAFGEEEQLDDSFSVKTMLPLAVATSIDALAVGVSFACIDVDIVPAIAIIGTTTFILSAVGIKIGNVFGAKYKSKAEFLGGAVLILLGLKIFRVLPRFVQKVDDRAGAHVGGTYALTLEDMARLDADMRHDPFVGRIDHGAQLFIRKDVIRQILTYTRYRCCYFTH